jgi:anti-anti-sigma regulatory factor
MVRHPVLHIGVEAGDDEATIVTPVGVLAVSTVPKLRKVLLRCIAEQPAAVIVDLGLLHVQAPANLKMFGMIARRTADLIGVRLLLVAGQPVEGRSLQTRAVARFVPVYPTVDAALASARRPSVRRQVRRRVRQGARDLGPVRRFVDETCEEWDCASITENAQLVTDELVSNALRHTRTDAEVRLHRRGRTLLVAVSDGDPHPPKLKQLDQEALPRSDGYGLIIVDALARRWGTTPLADGKLVWAALDAPA